MARTATARTILDEAARRGIEPQMRQAGEHLAADQLGRAFDTQQNVAADIAELLQSAGFEVERMESGPYGPVRPVKFDWTIDILEKLEDKEQLPTNLREDVIHAVGKKTGPVAERYPDWLYS